MIRRISTNLLLTFLTLMIGVAALEGMLRILHIYPSYSMPDPTIGFRLRPGARYRWTEEGFSEGRINRAGWRDRDYAERKPSGTVRIIFCGDSYTEAMHVPLDSTFHKRLERALNENAAGGAGSRYEVLAMGRSGMGTTEEYLAYRTWGVRYDPDIVAVLFVLNDFTDNARSIDPQREIRPYFVEEGDSLALDKSFLRTAGYRARLRWNPWKERSSLLTLMAKARNSLRLRQAEARREASIANRDVAIEFDRRVPADSIEAFRITEKILRRFARDVRRDGRRFVLFVASAARQEDPVLLERGKANPNFDPNKPERFLEAVGSRAGFDVVPLVDSFREESAVPGVKLWTVNRGVYGHWNDKGHAVAAAVMARTFTANARPSVSGSQDPR